MSTWFRLYTNVLDDPKVQRLCAEDFRRWINLLCLAKENDGLIPSIGDVAFRLRLTEAETNNLIEVLANQGLLDTDGETLMPHNWNGRQYASDSNAERMRLHRKKKRDAEHEHNSDGQSDVTVTPQIQSRAETETETEQSRGGVGDTPASRAKPRSARSTVCDDEWLAELQSNQAYVGLDVRRLYHKMVVWCEQRGKQPTRLRFVRWLNNEDQPMTADAVLPKPKNPAAYVGKNKPTVEEPMDDEEMADFVEIAIRANDLVYLAKLRDEIIKRGPIVLEWENRVITFFEQPIAGDEPVTPAEMADLNSRIADIPAARRMREISNG